VRQPQPTTALRGFEMRSAVTGLPPSVERDEYGRIRRVRVSAIGGQGLPLLRGALAEIALLKTGGTSRGASGAAVLQAVDRHLDSDGSP
ncbi:MAG: hypothetical protein NFW15_16340, partial [Candidatus Accumulibacter sp.]|nr:hypothetical protein [Accumulibacter sp.]MCM8637475.1 hypothetical protein [Accumulibacter sp.]MCM8640991.1 hypothetical protein [Accumulibacter sp.]